MTYVTCGSIVDWEAVSLPLPCEARVVSQAEFRSRDLLLDLDDATCRT